MHFFKFFFLVRRELDLPTNNPNWSAFRQNSDTHNCHHHLPCHCTDHIIRLEIINSMKSVEFLVEKKKRKLNQEEDAIVSKPIQLVNVRPGKKGR